MPNLSLYTGAPLPPAVTSFINKLEKADFVVATTTEGPNPKQRKTLRIIKNSVYIGQIVEALWGRKTPYMCLYRFPTTGKFMAENKAPVGFDKDAFAKNHGCNADLLYVHKDSGREYLWIQDEATSLLLMHDWAKRIDTVSTPLDGRKR